MPRRALKPEPPKRGRPPLPPSEAKRARVGVALTTDERRELMARARAAGLSVSEYLRACALSP